MKIIGLSFALSLPVFSAVSVLPPAPGGFEWQLVTSGQTDSSVVDVSSVETNLETALGITGSTAAPAAPVGSGSETVTLTAFGSPNPASYSLGDTIDLVTANTYLATLNVSNTAGVQNIDGAFLLVESKLSGVQISSSLGTTAPGSIVQSAAGTDAVILVNPNAAVGVMNSGSFGQIEGETIDFTFTANDELAFQAPFGGGGGSALPYFISSTVNPSLRRDTTFDTFELVETVPEPSSSLLLTLAAFGGLCFRRRA